MHCHGESAGCVDSGRAPAGHGWLTAMESFARHMRRCADHRDHGVRRFRDGVDAINKGRVRVRGEAVRHRGDSRGDRTGAAFEPADTDRPADKRWMECWAARRRCRTYSSGSLWQRIRTRRCCCVAKVVWEGNGGDRHSSQQQAKREAVDGGGYRGDGGERAEDELFGRAEVRVAANRRRGLAYSCRRTAERCSSTKWRRSPCHCSSSCCARLEHGEVLPSVGIAACDLAFEWYRPHSTICERKVEAGEFRHDLYFRLCTFEIELPPLRERRDDIRLLADYFAMKFGGQPGALAEETLAELERRPWYGNVRELRGAMEHALVFARRGTVMPEHLPPPSAELVASDASAIAGQAARSFERGFADREAAVGRPGHGGGGVRSLSATGRAASIGDRDEQMRPTLCAGSARAGVASHDAEEEADAV